MRKESKYALLLLMIIFIAACGTKKEKEKPKEEVRSKEKAILKTSPANPNNKTNGINSTNGTVNYTVPVACCDASYCTVGYADQMFVEVPNGDQYMEYDENPFLNTQKDVLSTFSIDADGGSYSNTRRFLFEGQLPPKASVRIEEYINYFTFDYAEPALGETVALNSEIATCPWNPEHHLIRMGIKGITLPKSAMKGANYVFLIDVSGSMSDPDKLELLKSGFKLMVDGLTRQDKVAIVTYAGSSEVLLASTPGDQKKKIKTAIDQLGADGGTNGADGIETAYKIAKENFIENGNNRVILGTDGDFNVGVSSTDELIKLIEAKRETGIFLTTIGVGRGNLNDYMMEQLANKGNGNYEYVDNPRQIEKVFIYEKSKFFTVAKDSKIQIRFNSNIVESYRLIGYENRALKNEDFEDDKKDAGEIGSSQTITALYEVVLKENSSTEPLANFDFRYKLPTSSTSRLINHKIQNTPTSILSSSDNMRFAAAISGFGLLMKQSVHKGNITKKLVLDLAGSALGYDPNGYRAEFVALVKKANI